MCPNRLGSWGGKGKCFTLYIGTSSYSRWAVKKELRSSTQIFPADTLLAPVRKSCDRQDVTKLNPVTPFERAWQEENLFLNIRGEAEQAHYLRHPRPCDASQPG